MNSHSQSIIPHKYHYIIYIILYHQSIINEHL